MARTSFRDRFLTPPVARAIMSPLGILLFGAATAGAILAGAPVAIAAGVGVAAWGGRVLAAVPRNPKTDRIEPFSLSDPWRSYVIGARDAKQRFDRVVADMPHGPLRARLHDVGIRLEDGVAESWRIASRGHDISQAIDRLETEAAYVELAQVRQAAGDNPSPSTQQTIASLEAQVATAHRMQTVADDARSRLRLLDARFDELVARAVEVSVGSADSELLGHDVDGLVTELESLRMAIEETNEASGAP
jgi:hypothetical protein